MKRLILSLAIFFPVIAMPLPADVSVCFTPGEQCDKKIISEIDSAKRTIYVQAYQLTSAPITDALARANRRGAKVLIILDKTQYRLKGYSAAIHFHDLHIPVWIDSKPAIAHNKVMIIDDKIVITGSYNFSANAQKRNAENMVIINSNDISNEYILNFNKRLNASTSFENY